MPPYGIKLKKPELFLSVVIMKRKNAKLPSEAKEPDTWLQRVLVDDERAEQDRPSRLPRDDAERPIHELGTNRSGCHLARKI
jgi:hypothetical protein